MELFDGMRLDARWDDGTALVTFSSGGGSGYLEERVVKEGFILPTTLDFFTPPAYMDADKAKIVGWYYWDPMQGESLTVAPGQPVTLPDQVNFDAVWDENTTGVRLLSGNGTGGSITVKVESGSTYTLPNLPSTFGAPCPGAAFVGWELTDDYLEANCLYAPGDSIVVNELMTFTAIWENIVEICLSNVELAGDESSIGLWMALLAISACGMMLTLKMRRA